MIIDKIIYDGLSWIIFRAIADIEPLSAGTLQARIALHLRSPDFLKYIRELQEQKKEENR